MPKKHSKRYRSALKVADLTKDYPLKEAVEILSKFPKAKFDETVELSFRLGVDATSGEQNVRGEANAAHGASIGTVGRRDAPSGLGAARRLGNICAVGAISRRRPAPRVAGPD